MFRTRFFLVASLFLLLGAVSAFSQQQAASSPTEASVRAALSAFLNAFENLDWAAFRACFSDDVTMFHPSAPNVRRIDTPEQFEKAWLGVFDRIRKSSGRDTPPYMDLRPLDLRIQMLSPDVALVTFHLLDGTLLNRRTILFRHESGAWKIVHIHASNLSAPDPPHTP